MIQVILYFVVFDFWLCVFIIHCKYPIYHHLIDVHLYKFFTCLDINKGCLSHGMQVNQFEHVILPDTRQATSL